MTSLYKYALAFLGALILNAGTTYSQVDTVRLTLDEVIEIAVAQSPDALIAKHRFRANYWQYRSYKADYLPLVQLQAQIPDISRTIRTIPVQDGPDIFQYNSLANYWVNMTVNQRVGFTGGSVFLRSNLSRLDNFYTDSTITQWSSEPIVIGYNQPIFQFNEYKWDRKIEPLLYEKAKREYLESQEQVKITAVNSFFNLLLAQIEKEIALKNLYNYDTLFNIAKGRFNLGKIAENDLLQLELNYLRAESSVDQAELNYENMLFKLKSYLRLKDDSRIELIPPTETSHFPVSTAKAIAEAKKNTSEALEFEERLLVAESDVRRAKMDGRFDADLYLEYGLTQSAFSLDEVYQDPKDQQRLSLGLSLPIVDWGVAKGKIKQAESYQELELTAVEQEVIDFEQNIFLEVMQFNMQEDQIKIAAKADTVAQKRFDVTQKRYMIGKVNDVLELNNAQIDNDTAKKGYFQALRSYWLNYYQLRRSTLYDFENNLLLIFDIREIM
jgi:outer membrane protein TolC